jgi:hypothetical protein
MHCVAICDAGAAMLEQLAERAEITPRDLQCIEAGDFGCSLAVLIRIWRALGCSWNKLWGGRRLVDNLLFAGISGNFVQIAKFFDPLSLVTSGVRFLHTSRAEGAALRMRAPTL